MSHDLVNHPKHYTQHPSGIECIQITRHMNFNLGSASKYIWRCDLKHNAIEDLRKAIWYITNEIDRRTAGGLSHDSADCYPIKYGVCIGGIESYKVTMHMNFNLANAMELILLCHVKHDSIKGLKKAIWHIDNEIDRRLNNGKSNRD